MTIAIRLARILGSIFVIAGIPIILSFLCLDITIPGAIKVFYDLVRYGIIWIINLFTAYDEIHFLLKLIPGLITVIIVFVVLISLILIFYFGFSHIAFLLFEKVKSSNYAKIYIPLYIYFFLNILLWVLLGINNFIGINVIPLDLIEKIQPYMLFFRNDLLGRPFNGTLFLQVFFLIFFYLSIASSKIGETCPYCDRFFTTEHVRTEDISNEEKDITKKESVRVGTEYITTTVTDGWNRHTHTDSRGIYEQQDVTRRYTVYNYVSTHHCKYCGHTFEIESSAKQELGSPGQYLFITGKGNMRHMISTKKK